MAGDMGSDNPIANVYAALGGDVSTEQVILDALSLRGLIQRALDDARVPDPDPRERGPLLADLDEATGCLVEKTDAYRAAAGKALQQIATHVGDDGSLEVTGPLSDALGAFSRAHTDYLDARRYYEQVIPPGLAVAATADMDTDGLPVDRLFEEPAVPPTDREMVRIIFSDVKEG